MHDEPTKVISIRLPVSLLRTIGRLAESVHLPRPVFIRQVLATEVERRAVELKARPK